MVIPGPIRHANKKGPDNQEKVSRTMLNCGEDTVLLRNYVGCHGRQPVAADLTGDPLKPGARIPNLSNRLNFQKKEIRPGTQRRAGRTRGQT